MLAIQVRLACAASAALFIAATLAVALAQQNVPPEPGALTPAETPAFKASRMLAAEAVKAGADTTASRSLP